MPATIQKFNAPLSQNIVHGVKIFLHPNNWDDFGYKTQFYITVQDAEGNQFKIGDVKIGYIGQPINSWTETAILNNSPGLDERFFSLGQDADYYKNLESLPVKLRDDVLSGLNDVVREPLNMVKAKGLHVFTTSILRGISLNTVNEQFARILAGGAVLTPFNFRYMKEQTENNAGIALDFTVQPNSLPSTNIHVLIGRNGIGKTTLLNNMISCLVEGEQIGVDVGNFHDLEHFGYPVNNKYFTSIISASFSAFDPFSPPHDRNAEGDAIRYTYVGLKEIQRKDGENKQRFSRHKDIHDLSSDFWASLSACISLEKKKERWLAAIEYLSSDTNFAEMNLSRLAEETNPVLREQYSKQFFSRMSSGHAVVLLTLTKLVERTEEKTLVLMDEPESHLHPPLLSAFIRALSSLLNNRNGVAIIATHSPVILQEVPKSCVWKLRRTRLILKADRPDDETFGENVGSLTRDVFGLEVINSGFHSMLKKLVDQGKSYEAIVQEFNGQIGFEGKAMLRALISNRNG